MNKNTLTIVSFIALAIIIGLSNCSCNIWTAFVSACVGYVCAKLANYLDGRFF